MSLLLRKRLRVVLCREQLALSVVARGWRQKTSDTIIVPCDAVASAPDWAPALGCLDKWLEQNKAASDVEVILSDSLVRYAIIPWSADITAREERRTMARIHFESVFGPMPGQWEFQVASSGYGQARIACALDAQLSSALRAVFSIHKLRMVSLRPYLMCVFNRWHVQISADALLAVVATDHCMMAGITAGQWSSVRRLRLGDTSGTHLRQLMDRELVLQGLNGATVYLHAPGKDMAAQLPDNGPAIMLGASADETTVAAAMMAACGNEP